MDRDPIMDPAASPTRVGVRRVNNLPVVILGGAVAVFLGIMAYVTAGRAAEREAGEKPEAVRSARSLAESVAGDHEAGTVPAAVTGATSATRAAGAADSQMARGVGAAQGPARGQGRFP